MKTHYDDGRIALARQALGIEIDPRQTKSAVDLLAPEVLPLG